MLAVVTTGNGGLDKLEYREVRRPQPGEGEVARPASWPPASTPRTSIPAPAGTGTAGGAPRRPFPFIQGTDCCGRVAERDPASMRRCWATRILVRACMRPQGFSAPETVWLGSDSDGAFAQYVLAPASEVFPVSSGLSDAELGVVPCSFGTAENMLARAGVRPGQHVVVTGASGGVGSAVVQLARLRGAEVTAVAGAGKADQVLGLGAARVVDRGDDVVAVLGEQAVDVVVDNVSGPGLDRPARGPAPRRRLRLVRRDRGSRGRASTSAAFYLRDLTLLGCTAWDEAVFPALVERLERDELRPPVAATFPLERIAQAQTEFLEKRHVGSYVLVPPGDDAGRPATRPHSRTTGRASRSAASSPGSPRSRAPGARRARVRAPRRRPRRPACSARRSRRRGVSGSARSRGSPSASSHSRTGAISRATSSTARLPRSCSSKAMCVRRVRTSSTWQRRLVSTAKRTSAARYVSAPSSGARQRRLLTMRSRTRSAIVP